MPCLQFAPQEKEKEEEGAKVERLKEKMKGVEEEDEMKEEDENERLARFTSSTASVIAALAARPTKVPTFVD